MDATRRITHLRRVATTASLAALILVPAGQAEAKKSKHPLPVITSVSPMTATVGQKLTIDGRNFRKGKGRNSIGFKREGSAVVFVKSDLSTTKTMTVRLSKRLEEVMFGTPQVFHLRVLAGRYGKAYTSDKLSPTIKPRPADAVGGPGAAATPTPVPGAIAAPTPVAAPVKNDPHVDSANCDDDNLLNGADDDDDNDGLSDKLENDIGTDTCLRDTDGDGVVDGYEYRSAIDLNDDEYQHPNQSLPYPGKKLPYPNPLDKDDANTDHDGDGLTLAQEQRLWLLSTPKDQQTVFTLPAGSPKSSPLSYSDGLQYSVSEHCPTAANPAACPAQDANLRVPTLAANNYSNFIDFTNWATKAGYLPTIRLHEWGFVDHNNTPHQEGRVDASPFDIDRDGTVSPDEQFTLDRDLDGFLSDDERDEDSDGLSNFDEFNGRMLPTYWTSCYSTEPAYPVPYLGTDAVVADTDGDGIRDGLDDQDHDDYPNMMELSRIRASHADDRSHGKNCKAAETLKPDEANHSALYGKVNPFNPCDPDPDSRTCQRYVTLGTELGPDWWALQ